MPTITVPLLDYSDVPQLRKSKSFRRVADAMLLLAQQEALIKAKAAELRLEMYDILKSNLDDTTKSVAYEAHRFTRIDPGESRSFDKGKLMSRPLQCEGCPSCKKKKVTIHVTAVDIEACTTVSSRRPTVQLVPLKNSRSEEAE